jgi:hypothetical protein
MDNECKKARKWSNDKRKSEKATGLGYAPGVQTETLCKDTRHEGENDNEKK